MADSLTLPDAPATSDTAEAGATPPLKQGVVPGSALLNTGWLFTATAFNVLDLPLQLVLKDTLGYSAAQTASFLFVGKTASYVKPFMGVFSDAVPLCGTRRYHYLQLSLIVGAVFFILLGLAPKLWPGWMLPLYVMVFLWMNLASTVLGGLMVDLGKQYGATGRLSSDRQGITKGSEMISGYLSGLLAKLDFIVTGVICAALYLILSPIMRRYLKEAPVPRRTTTVWTDLRTQFTALMRSRALLAAAGLIILIVAAPGFKTPLLYFQRDQLGFSTELVGFLKLLGGASSIIAALVYSRLCYLMTLRKLLAISIIFHAVMTLWYLLYRDASSAMIITCIESATMIWALLPLYDLAARATPKGSEALGYSLMMSVWNFTTELSDVAGSWLTTAVVKGGAGFHFHHLVWVNAASTLVVLLAVPFLPSALVDRRDGQGGQP